MSSSQIESCNRRRVVTFVYNTYGLDFLEFSTTEVRLQNKKVNWHIHKVFDILETKSCII